ncbi:MAG: aminopeptidase [archaeon]
MHSDELIRWMRDKNLTSIAKTQVPQLKNVIINSLNIRREGVLIIGDYGQPGNLCAPILAAGYYMATQSLGLNTVLVMQGVKDRSTQADSSVKYLLEKLKKENAIILSLSNRLGKLGELGNIRGWIKKRKHKYLITTGLIGLRTEQTYALADSININYKKIAKVGEKIKQELDWAREIRIITLSGTNLKVDVTGHKALSNTGYVKEQGSGGNIPAGEVYIAPTKHGVDGQVVIDGSSRHKHGTMLINKPIKVTISRGMITKVEGGEEAKILQNSIDWIKNRVRQPSSASMIGELGIGINPRAKIIGATIVDEKAYGTAHLGIGGNYWFGGHVFSSLHLDQVFRNPIIMVDGKELKMPRRNELE